MALSIRPIAHDDPATIVALLQGASLTPDAEDPREIDRYWAAVEETRARQGDVFVAELDGAPVGVVQAMVFPHFQHQGGWCCELESVHVREDLRGRGIGAHLLGAAEQLARQRGCYRLQLTNRNVRVDAHRFFLANGYDQTSQGFKQLL